MQAYTLNTYKSLHVCYLQCFTVNPSNPRFLKPPNESNQKLFLLNTPYLVKHCNLTSAFSKS